MELKIRMSEKTFPSFSIQTDRHTYNLQKWFGFRFGINSLKNKNPHSQGLQDVWGYTVMFAPKNFILLSQVLCLSI